MVEVGFPLVKKRGHIDCNAEMMRILPT